MHDDLNAEARTEVAMNGCGPCCSGVRSSRCDRQGTLGWLGGPEGAVCGLLWVIGPRVDGTSRKFANTQGTRLAYEAGRLVAGGWWLVAGLLVAGGWRSGDLAS